MAPTTTSGTTKLFAVLIAAATFTSLAGCSGGSETPDSADPGTSSSDGTSRDDDGDDEGDSDDPGCLIGDWIATDSGLEGWYSAFVPNEDVVVNSVTGEILMSFSDTDFIFSTRELTVSMSIGDQEVRTKMTGGTAGTYFTSPGGIMSTTVETSDLDAKASVSGIEFSASELGLDLEGAGSFAGYECTGGNLVLETQSAGSGTALIALEPAN